MWFDAFERFGMGRHGGVGCLGCGGVNDERCYCSVLIMLADGYRHANVTE